MVNRQLLLSYADAAGWQSGWKSSNVRAAAYSADFKYLFIRFGKPNGTVIRTYVYRDVDAGVFAGLLAAPSKGEYVARVVKPHYHDYDPLD